MENRGSKMEDRIAPLPVPSPHSFRLRADATADRSSWGEGDMLFAEEKVGLLPRPVRNPPSRRRYGAAGERGEGKGRGAAHLSGSGSPCVRPSMGTYHEPARPGRTSESAPEDGHKNKCPYGRLFL